MRRTGKTRRRSRRPGERMRRRRMRRTRRKRTGETPRRNRRTYEARRRRSKGGTTMRRTGEPMRRRRRPCETRRRKGRMTKRSRAGRRLCSFFRNIFHVPSHNPEGGFLPREYIHFLLESMCKISLAAKHKICFLR